MQTLPVFVVQFGWFLCVWAAVVRFVVWPLSLRLPETRRLALWVAPQMFRVLGLGLLVPNLAPGLSPTFARATALGDSLTAILALGAFLGLMEGWRSGRTLAWACTIVGMADLLVALPHAAHVGAAAHLTAQWYVPVLAVPLMLVAHGACLATLLGARSSPTNAEAA